MIPTQFTDWINNLIHLLQRHSVHLPVQFIEVFIGLFVVERFILRQLLSRGKITFYSLIFMEWAMNCKVCVLWALW